MLISKIEKRVQSVIYIQGVHRAERTTFEEEKRKKDKIGRCYIIHPVHKARRRREDKYSAKRLGTKIKFALS